MKKTLLIIVVIFISSSTAFSQFQLGFGGALGAGSGYDIDAVDQSTLGYGPHIRGLFSISDNVALVAGFTYFLPKNEWNFMDATFDLNLNFVNDQGLKAYFLGGGNYTGYKDADNDAFWAFGFHFGAGVVIHKLFIEVKYDLEIDKDPMWRKGQIAGVIGFYF